MMLDVELDSIHTWRNDAACRRTDPDEVQRMLDLMFSIDLPGKRAALAVCARCPVIEECLDEALAIGPSNAQGVWGGTDEGERDKIRRRRQKASWYVARTRSMADG